MVPFIHHQVIAERKVTESLFGDIAFDKRPCEVTDQAVKVPRLGLLGGGARGPSMQRPCDSCVHNSELRCKPPKTIYVVHVDLNLF